jgi:uncharacterized protein YndB with AHSA1/START domain
MRNKILLAVGVLLLGLIGYIAMQPTAFRIERSLVLAAPLARVFEKVNDFHQWEVWSPWAKLDPKMTQSYSGTTSGVGAVYTWAGNSDVGEGRMTLTESRPDERILIKLEFLQPMAAVNLTEFTFQPEAGKTKVTWVMTGDRNFMTKAFNLFMNLDQMIGGDFEKGLSQLKGLVESPAKP